MRRAGEAVERVGDAWQRRGGAGVVHVTRHGELVFERVTLQRGHEQFTVESGFDVGSLTKPFTAAAIFELEAMGAVSADDPLGRFFDHAPPDKRGINFARS